MQHPPIFFLEGLSILLRKGLLLFEVKEFGGPRTTVTPVLI